MAAGKRAEGSDRTSGGNLLKHVSIEGVAVGPPLDDTMAAVYRVENKDELTPLACAWCERARGADRITSSFGDFHRIV